MHSAKMNNDDKHIIYGLHGYWYVDEFGEVEYVPYNQEKK